jgi:exo-beta-1,3-glucanase (GH17 family)
MTIDYFFYSVIIIILGAIIYDLFKKGLSKAKQFFNRTERICWIYLIIMIGFSVGIETFRYFKIQFCVTDFVETLIHSNKWISYVPSEFNPYIEKHPTNTSIEKDLKLIKKLGFDGIITFNCNYYMNIIPQLSEKYKLKVIVGIWNPNNKFEVANSISLQNKVDGYCIGHNGLKKEYSFNDLKMTIKLVRNTTNKPVSTTVPIKYYIKDSKLINLVDWIFPDGSLPLFDSVNIERDVKDLVQLTRNLDEENHNNKPILLKMIIYPYDSLKNASEENQSLFYSKLIDCIIDNTSNMPSNASISFHGLYDPYWKRAPDFYFWEPFTGLVDSSGMPRQSLNTIMKKLKQLQ